MSDPRNEKKKYLHATTNAGLNKIVIVELRCTCLVSYFCSNMATIGVAVSELTRKESIIKRQVERKDIFAIHGPSGILKVQPFCSQDIRSMSSGA